MSVGSQLSLPLFKDIVRSTGFDEMKGQNFMEGNTSRQQLLEVTTKSHEQVFCQKVHKNFNMTPSGRIAEHDITEIYCLMLINLDLKKAQPKKFNSFIKQHSFTFTIKQALQYLAHLIYEIPTNAVTITFSYKINHDSAVAFLQKFFDAKLLHFPSNRTCNRFYLSNMPLQPTPKGIAILNGFMEKHGVRWNNLPAIIKSAFNSMKLFCFERNISDGKIVYSTSMIKVLLVSMLGDEPNVWNVNHKPEDVSNCVKKNISVFLTQVDSPCTNDVTCQQTSPFHHTYFTNPASDSHIQYYSSCRGLKVFYNKEFGNIKFRYSFSGKSIVQWLMDCTDILSLKQALEICNLFLRLKFLTQVMQTPASTSSMFLGTDEAFYVLAPTAKAISNWYAPKEKTFITTIAASKLKRYNLETFLKDPGLTMIFKVHLENEYCSENLKAYTQLKKLNRKLALLDKLLDYCESHHIVRHNEKTKNLVNDCLSLAYHIFFTYLSEDAAFVVNIDYSLRERMTTLMMENKESPKELESALNRATIIERYDDMSFDSGANDLQPPLIDPSNSSGSQTVATKAISPGSSIETPISADLFEALEILARFTPLVNETLSALFKLMEIDSFPKFLEGEVLQSYRCLLEA